MVSIPKMGRKRWSPQKGDLGGLVVSPEGRKTKGARGLNPPKENVVSQKEEEVVSPKYRNDSGLPKRKTREDLYPRPPTATVASVGL